MFRKLISSFVLASMLVTWLPTGLSVSKVKATSPWDDWDYRITFPDVSLMAWYAPYVFKAYSLGIVEGYKDGTFQPERMVQYDEFVKILAKLLEHRVAEWED